MRLTPPQQIVSADPNRFRVVAAGRRWGKSWLAMNEMAKYARFPGKRILAVAPTYKQCKNIWWNDLKSMLIERNWIKKINETELTLTLVNNSTITLRSSENRDALRGGKYDFIVLDECAYMDPDVWYSVLRPTLSDTGGSALFITSPQGRNWIYDLWVNAKTEKDWNAFQFTTASGGNVPIEEIEAARRDLDHRRFQTEYEAEFVNYAGVIFYAYSDEHNLKKYPGDLAAANTLHLSIDFNTSPITCGVWVKNGDVLWCVDEIEIFGSNTLELVQEVRNRYGNRQYIAYPDATGSRKNTNSNGVSDHLILQNNGFKLVTDNINPNVNDSISAVNSMLCNSMGERKLFIDPKCKMIRQCMLKYVYKENTRIPDKDNVHDHFADGIRYICYRLFPPRQLPQIDPRERQTRMAAGRMFS